MANDHIEYLSANVLNDGQTVSRATLLVYDCLLTPEEQVSYRTLSRALRVHNNLAKQMLYDFHRTQNKKQPNSLHATYLVTGIQSLPPQQAESQDASDRTTQTSPTHQRPDGYQATSLLLVDEDNLDSQSAWSIRDRRLIFANVHTGSKSTFDDVLSIHVYSIQPTKINVSLYSKNLFLRE